MRLSANLKRNAWRLSALHFSAFLGFALLVSVLADGVGGAVFTGGIALAFLLGAIDRRDLFHLRAGFLPRDMESRSTLERELSDCPDALCIVLEIDDLADVRRRLGERGLDNVVAQIAVRLRACVRAGDGFAVLSPGRFGLRLRESQQNRLENAMQATARLQACTDAPLRADGLNIRVALSAGFAQATRLRCEPQSCRSLLDAAELALKAAKGAGPGSLRAFDPRMHTCSDTEPQAPAHDGISTRLEDALNDGQIMPWFQPQISCDTGRITGFEALARWSHPDRGILPPAAFLGPAEAAGCMSQLTDAILDGALAQLAEWDRCGLRVPRVSVNIGTTDLADPMLVERVRWSLDRTGIAPQRLGIEILETVVAEPHPDTVCARNVSALAGLGCIIELDDFGTGSASIAGIRRFAVHRIKIDRSLVVALDKDRAQHEMVAAILTMAEQLNVSVLAEGVETPGEHAALADLGVADVQGFTIARPMSGADATDWIRRRDQVVPPLPPALTALLPQSCADIQTTKAAPNGKTA